MKGFEIIHSSLHTLKVHTNFIFPSLLKYTCSLSVLSSGQLCSVSACSGCGRAVCSLRLNTFIFLRTGPHSMWNSCFWDTAAAEKTSRPRKEKSQVYSEFSLKKRQGDVSLREMYSLSTLKTGNGKNSHRCS